MSDLEISADWPRVKVPPPLESGAVHVWRFAVDRRADQLADLAILLDDEERRRAERFRWPRLRHRFTAGRGLMRTILGLYVATAPAALRFQYNAYGKPSLADPVTTRGGESLDLRFNLSHSENWALLAVAAGREVGADIEHIRADLRFEQLAEHFFSAAEVAALAATAEPERRRAFFACWTRKEAYIKALGRGLSVPLDSFDVSVAPDVQSVALAVRDLPLEPDRWLIAACEPAENYFAAICVERPITALWQAEWAA